MNESHLQALEVINVFDITKVEGEERDFCRVISDGLDLFVRQITSPACPLDFLDEASELSEPVDAALHVLVKDYNL